MAKFPKCGVWDRVPEGSTLTLITLICVEFRSRAKKQQYLFNRFDRTPTCDRQTQGHSYSTRASIASRLKRLVGFHERQLNLPGVFLVFNIPSQEIGWKDRIRFEVVLVE